MSDTFENRTFADRMIRALNEAGLCLMTSIGHRAGLFDALRDQPPMSSQELAVRAGRNERYVREWLGAMATAGVVVVEGERFRLPAAHAASLTRAAGVDNLASYTQYIALLGSVEDELVECFRQGGGVPYDRYPRFHEIMAEDSSQSVALALESSILPLVPGLADRLRHGIQVLDVGCGCGRVLNRMAELFPASRFVGKDLSTEAIGRANHDAAHRGLRNVTFVEEDLSNFDQTAEQESFDLVLTLDAIHDQGKPLAVLRGICRSLRLDGTYLMQEIRASSHVDRNVDHPLGTFLYTISCMHCMTVSLASGGEGLGAMWGEEKIRQYLANAGFGAVVKYELPHDIQNDWFVVRKA